MKLGELLIEKGWICLAQLTYCLHLQKKLQCKLGIIMVERGLLTESQLIQALHEQLGLPYASMFEATLDPNLNRYIPALVARKYCLIPIRKINGKLIVAMDDPLNGEVIRLIGDGSGLDISPVLAAKSEIVSAISSIYSFE